jgi:poly-beta-1,6-N-acetyl-D-glucosamine synthase
MRAIFWISAAAVLYVYAGYPVALAVWTRLRPAAPARRDGTLRTVSIVLAARNEGDRLAARLDNLLALDYPAGRREILVVSDGSTDSTADVLRRYAPDVRSLWLPASGKANALNTGAAAARHEILVFADARQHFASDALRRLVELFADPRVGAVSGELMIDADAGPLVEGPGSPVAEGVGLYWRYEKWLRQRESDMGSMLGATGAIWAIRRAAWRPLPPQTLLDDVLAPMRVVLDGCRVVLAPRARAYDRSSPDASTERRRKVRTLAGNYQLLQLEPRLLVPIVNPVWLQFVSHKLGRLLVPYALGALLVASAALAQEGIVYAVALTLQVTFYVLAAHGAVIALTGDAERRPGATPTVGPARADVEKEWVNAQLD